MTPKEKAKELVSKMERPMEGVSIFRLAAKQLSFIAVNEQIELLLNLSPYMAFPEQVKHLQEVKQEIEKL